VTVAQLRQCAGPRCVLGPNSTSLFRCGKRSLKPVVRGSRILFWCAWLNDECIGVKCQFAYCEARSMTPEGLCARLAEGGRAREVDIVEEAKKLEREDEKLRAHLKRIGLGDYL
jgi:hypothetical protein